MTSHINCHALDAADVDGFVQHVAAAAGFARMFADERAGGRERVVLADQADGIGITAFGSQGDVARNIDAGRT